MAQKWRFFTPREAVVHEPSSLNAIAIQPGVKEAAIDDDARPRFARDGKLHVAAAEPGMRLAQNGTSFSHFNLRLPRACPGKCSCFIHKETIERKDCFLTPLRGWSIDGSQARHRRRAWLATARQ